MDDQPDQDDPEPAGIPLADVVTAADFGRCMDRVRTLAGPLSHREIEKRSRGHCGRTKIGHAIKGQLPRRDFLCHYLTACGVTGAGQVPWLAVWARVAQDSAGPLAPGSAMEQAADILERARAEADGIVTAAHTEADAVREHNTRLMRETEAQRDAAHDRATGLADEVDRVHDSALKRIRDAEDSRDEAIARASALAADLERLHAETRQRIFDAEQDRDAAIDQTRRLNTQMTDMHENFARLREDLMSSTEAIAEGIGRALGDINKELESLRDQIREIGVPTRFRPQPTTLSDPDVDLWADNRRTVQAVIGLPADNR